MAEIRHTPDGPEKSSKVPKKQEPERNIELVPLSLPPGVTPELAAKLTTSILMRQVYCSKCPWTQWILLASVGILHGQSTPTLDSVSLHRLQGTVNEKLATCRDLINDAGLSAEPHSFLEEKEEEMKNLEKSTASNETSFAKDTESTDLKGTPNVIEQKYPQSTLPGHRNDSEKIAGPLKNENHINVFPEKDNTLQRQSTALPHRKNVGIQITPKKLGILVSKWVQPKLPRRTEIGLQTDFNHETMKWNKNETQTHDGNIGCLPKTFVNKGVQTLIKIRRDASSQTDSVNLKVEDHLSQPLWRMISLSNLPTRKKHKASGKNPKMENDSDNLEKHNLRKGLKAGITEKSVIEENLNFHGRPVMRDQSEPIEIPLDSVNLIDSGFQDPRL